MPVLPEGGSRRMVSSLIRPIASFISASKRAIIRAFSPMRRMNDAASSRLCGAGAPALVLVLGDFDIFDSETG